MSDHLQFLNRAIALSKKNMDQNSGGPFGAVVVRHGVIVSEGCNRVTSNNDPTAHAEVDAIRAACEKLKTFDLSDCEIYSSCEPCPMCLSAIYWARIKNVYYANTKEDAASISFDDQFIYEELAKEKKDRALKMTHLESESAKSVFQAWQKKSDKIPY